MTFSNTSVTNKAMLISLLSIVLISSMFSCAKDVGEDLYPCEIIDNVSYSSEISPIISQNCYKCHSISSAPVSSGIVLEGYSNLKKYVDDGKLSCAINHYDCALNMPIGEDKLDQCVINKIEAWINEGALNN